jgi:hypothetical protein
VSKALRRFVSDAVILARALIFVTALTLGAVLLVWLVVNGLVMVFPDRGTAIANDIRDAEHPLIETIEYGGDDDSSGPMIEIWLRAGTTREQARAIACDVVNPAVERGSPPEALGYVLYDSEGEFLATDQTPCL